MNPLSFAPIVAHPALACAALLIVSNPWAGLCLMGAVYFIFRG